MSHVTNLTQLSIEDNEIASLAGIEPLTQLMELYAANNRLMVRTGFRAGFRATVCFGQM